MTSGGLDSSIDGAIAERRLTQQGEPVRVQVFGPVACGEDFGCRFKIEGLKGAEKPIEREIPLSFGGECYVAIF